MPPWLVLAALATVWARGAVPPSAGPADRAGADVTVHAATDRPPPHSRLRSYLTRPVARSARYLDHGVLGASVAGGFPHLYRVGLSLGLLDHLTIGATAHWLPRHDAPGWSPTGSLAVWRGRLMEVGASYHQTLHPPPALDTNPTTPSFVERTHWVLGALTFSQSFISGGFDLGMVRARDRDPRAGASEDLDTPFVVRHRLAGGLHARLGTRRWGVTAQALWPRLEAELVLDVRFGLFERRPRGEWWPGRVREAAYRKENY